MKKMLVLLMMGFVSSAAYAGSTCSHIDLTPRDENGCQENKTHDCANGRVERYLNTKCNTEKPYSLTLLTDGRTSSPCDEHPNDPTSTLCPPRQDEKTGLMEVRRLLLVCCNGKPQAPAKQ